MELLSCPFCKSEAIQVIGFRNSHCVAFIQCTNCESQGEKFENKFDIIAKENSIKAWNTRPSQWVSVKEKVPDDADNYIVYTKYGCIELSHFLPSLKCFAEDYVTHYMPLPTPPTNL